MPGYTIPGTPLRDQDDLRKHPVARRLHRAGPWQFIDLPGGGSFATFRGEKASPDAYASPEETFDGMKFHADVGVRDPGDLGKVDLPDNIPVTMSTGLLLSVAIATRAARARGFVPGKIIGDFIGEYPKAVFNLAERLVREEVVRKDDPELCRALFLAIALCYRVTEESLTAYGWVTTEDDNRIMEAAYGAHPKAGAPAGAS